jgi:hypothetical protein
VEEINYYTLSVLVVYFEALQGDALKMAVIVKLLCILGGY